MVANGPFAKQCPVLGGHDRCLLQHSQSRLPKLTLSPFGVSILRLSASIFGRVLLLGCSGLLGFADVGVLFSAFVDDEDDMVFSTRFSSCIHWSHLSLSMLGGGTTCCLVLFFRHFVNSATSLADIFGGGGGGGWVLAALLDADAGAFDRGGVALLTLGSRVAASLLRDLFAALSLAARLAISVSAPEEGIDGPAMVAALRRLLLPLGFGLSVWGA